MHHLLVYILLGSSGARDNSSGRAPINPPLGILKAMISNKKLMLLIIASSLRFVGGFSLGRYFTNTLCNHLCAIDIVSILVEDGGVIIRPCLFDSLLWVLCSYNPIYFSRAFPDSSSSYSLYNALIICLGGSSSAYLGGLVADTWATKQRSGWRSPK